MFRVQLSQELRLHLSEENSLRASWYSSALSKSLSASVDGSDTAKGKSKLNGL